MSALLPLPLGGNFDLPLEVGVDASSAPRRARGQNRRGRPDAGGHALGRWLAALTLSAVIVSCVWAQTPRTIRVVLDKNYTPYSFRSDDGQVQGILIDQWRAWEKQTGHKVEIHALDWGDALQRMRAGEFDVIDAIVETEERRSEFDFTPDYATIEVPIFFRSEISGIVDLASLKGFPVGVKAGDQHIDKLRAAGVTTLIPFPNFDAMVAAAKQHKINVFVADAPGVLYLLHKAGIETEFRCSTPIFHDGLQRAVRKGHEELLRQVIDGFAAIDPRELKQIDRKWYGRTLDGSGDYLLNAGYAAAAMLAIVAGLIGWNRMLRKRVQQRTAELSESERRLRQIAEHIDEVVWLTTGDLSKALYVSPAFEVVWGQTRESFYQDPRTIFAAIHPADRVRAFEAIEKNRELGFDLEYRVVRPDGSIRWLWDRGFPIQDETARVARIAGITKDITEQKLAAEAGKREEDRIRLIIDTIPMMAWSLRPDGVVDFLNQRWLDYAGLTLEEYGNDPAKVVHPDDFARAAEHGRKAMVAGEASEDEMRLRRADGSFRWFLVRTAPLRDAQGRIVKWFGSSIEIEDRKKTEEALRDSERRLREQEEFYRLLTENANDFIRMHELDGRSIYASPSVRRLFGRDPTYQSEFAHPDDLAAWRTWFTQAVTGGRQRLFWRVRDQYGSWRWMETQGSLVQYERRPRLMTVCREVTERKEAEEALRTSERQLHSLVGRMNTVREDEAKRIARELHDDLGQKLTALNMGLADLETNLGAATIGQRAQLTQMHANVDQMIEVVHELASELRLGQLDILGLTAAIEWQLKEFSRRSKIQCKVTRLDEITQLSDAQRTAVFRILQEALTNIVRHAGATSVEVSLQAAPDQLALRIHDNGRGITPAELSDPKAIGLLGMRERAEIVGGTVTIAGELGRGTTVLVTVPLKPNGKISV